MDPKTGHEDNDVVAGKRFGKGGELSATGLICVVDLICVVSEAH